MPGRQRPSVELGMVMRQGLWLAGQQAGDFGGWLGPCGVIILPWIWAAVWPPRVSPPS